MCSVSNYAQCIIIFILLLVVFNKDVVREIKKRLICVSSVFQIVIKQHYKTRIDTFFFWHFKLPIKRNCRIAKPQVMRLSNGTHCEKKFHSAYVNNFNVCTNCIVNKEKWYIPINNISVRLFIANNMLSCSTV